MDTVKKKWEELAFLFEKGSRFIWEPLPNKLNNDNWFGDVDPVDGKRKMGLSQQAYAVLDEAMKAAFIAGHRYGAEATLSVVRPNSDEFTFDPDLDAACASRAWDQVKDEI